MKLTHAIRSGVPNLWPAKPQIVALDLSTNERKNIYEKLQKLTVLQDIGLLKIIVTTCYCKLYYFETYK